MNDRETLDIQLNVFGQFDPVLSEKYKRTEYVFLANGVPALQMKVLDQVPGCRLVVADTMELWIQTTHDDLMKLFKRIDGPRDQRQRGQDAGRDGKPRFGRPPRSRDGAAIRRHQKGRARARCFSASTKRT